MRRHLPRECVQSSDLFRSRFCYVESTDAVLAKYEGTLYNLYENYSAVHHVANDKTSHRRLLSCGEWVALCDHLGLLRSGNLTLIEAKLIFTWSRIRSASSYSEHSQLRLRNFQFEDFLEAVVRLAVMIALPTDGEIEAVGAADAGEYLMTLRASEAEMHEFIQRRKRPWYNEPAQNAGRCVAHLLSLVVRLIETNTRGTKDEAVSKDEARTFAALGAGASRSEGLVLQLSSGRHELGAFRTAMSQVEEQLLHTLSQVPIFGRLTEQQLVAVRDSSTRAGSNACHACRPARAYTQGAALG